MEERDRPHYLELLRLLDAVDNWLPRIDPVGERVNVHPRSPLHKDDERTHPYETSSGAWHALSHAVDQLACLRSLLRDARVIHMYAPYSLVRPALENASTAVWILHPASRPERVARRLRLASLDIRNGEYVRRLAKKAGPRTELERLTEVRDIAARAGVDSAEAVRKVGYGEIIKAASEVLAPTSDAVPVAWRVCSGISHGDFWTTINIAEQVELPGARPGMGAFQISANVKILMYVTTFAVHMTTAGRKSYDDRRRAPY